MDSDQHEYSLSVAMTDIVISKTPVAGNTVDPSKPQLYAQEQLRLLLFSKGYYLPASR
jgi:hypothetical protein